MKAPVGILHVKVVRALKLKKKDIMGGADPYVKLKLKDDKLASKKTTVKYKNLNPEWNEEFNVVIKDPESQALMLNVYDWEQVTSTFTCKFRFKMKFKKFRVKFKILQKSRDQFTILNILGTNLHKIKNRDQFHPN
jgi:hypothetical protein